DDDFPFIHPNGKVLYFSSKGHNSMGGYDIYKSYLNEQTNEWEKPINVDFAINTPFDDYLLITNLDENKGFFTSNRYSKGSEVNVYQIEMTRVPVDFSIIVGQFVAQNSKNAKITVQDMYNNTEIGVFETNPKGE